VGVEFGEEDLSRFFLLAAPFLDERQRRLLGASMVEVLGRGGQARVAAASGMSRNTLIAGAKELAEGPGLQARVRRPGAGPKRKIDVDPELLVILDSLVEPGSRGDPMSPLRWTLKSTRVLAGELTRLGHKVGANLVGDLLHYLGYSLQANAKVTEGAQHRDRDGQFGYINDQAKAHLDAGQPVISVDSKKKENVGKYANVGKEWELQGEPTRVGVHDFPDPEMGKAIPYGVLDVGANEGWVNVGDDHDTPAFAVASIARWWQRMGKARYPDATRLLITADAGGSNSYRSRVFKVELAKLAAAIGLVITVCHMPPGTSKWNKIEHRMFSFITMNWRGKPLTTYRTVIELIAATTTRTGLKIQADLDTGYYPTGVKITDKQLQALPLQPHQWHPDWNYSILPP
jgi:Rhodopirellula transposase DDE domain